MIDRLEFIRETLQEASQTILDYYQSDLSIEHKADDSPVTIADKETEAQIRRAIAEHFPDDAIYGEEGGMSEGSDGVWITDPIDGTKNFIAQNPLFGSLLGYQSQGRMVAGGAALPALGQIWTAKTGQPTRCNAQEVRVSGQKDHKKAHLAATAPEYFNAPQYALFQQVSENVAFQFFGGDCTLFTSLASNNGVDIVMEAGMKPYDYLPLVPIVEGAGGIMTDWQGKALGLDSSGEVLACASHELHQWALDLIQKKRKTLSE